MGLKVAFATSAEYLDLHPDDRLTLPLLGECGIAVDAVEWTSEAARWQDYDAVVIRSCWDYFTRADQFRAWLRRLQSLAVPCFNPPPVVTENMDKRYLRTLEAKGASTVPTVWIEPTQAGRLPALVGALPWEDLVVKPAVSAGAFRTVRTTRRSLLSDASPLREVLQGSTALVQPFLPEIAREGEWSFLFFGDEFSHAVVKRPKAGDFRVQWRHGGTHAKVTPSAKLVGEAKKILTLLPPGRLYTRIDGVESGGKFLLVEVELIEPYLFFQEDPESAGRFAKALAARLTSRF